MMMAQAQKPLMLKDYLELDDDDDDDSDSSVSSGLAGAATIRRLLEAELRAAAERLVPTVPSNKNALTKFSAAINAVKLLPFPSSDDGGCLPSGPDGCLSRSFSMRLRGSLWRKKKKKKERAAQPPPAESAARVNDIVRLRPAEANGEGWGSLRFPSPVASSRSSWSETDSSGSDFLPTSMASPESPADIAASAGDGTKDSPSRNPNPNPTHVSEKRADGEESEDEAIARRAVAKECNSEEEEEKDQLSPVSVIDYPYQQDHRNDDYDNSNNNNDDNEEEESTTISSPKFYHSLANIERTREQLLHRIRRFEMLAELDPTDLEAEDILESTNHVAPSGAEAEEEAARGLLGELKGGPLEEGPRGSMERLLLDFFIQGQSRSGGAHRDRPLRWGQTRTSRAFRLETREMLNAARDWIDGRRCREVDDHHGAATLREMERNGRWRCFDEDEEELGAHLEATLFESLVEELVQDLAWP